MPYLDHAATSPMRPEAIAAVTACLPLVGNPSSIHAAGRGVRRVLEDSRESLAAAVGADPGGVILTGGGTESDNLAVKGLYWARRAQDDRRRRIVSGPIEHSAVHASVRWLVEHEGAEVVMLGTGPDGVVHPGVLRDALAATPDEVALVTVMWANNEVGSLSPIADLSEVAHEFGVPLHTDAVQAIGHVPVSFADCGADALSLTAHKLGGPLGAGALLLRRGMTPTALLHGGGQERGLRSGTLDAAGASGLAAAAVAAVSDQPGAARRLQGLRNDLVARIQEAVPDAVLNGPALDGPRLPGNASLSFPGCPGDVMLMLLDDADIACSAGSACSAGVLRPSPVLLTLGVPEELAVGALRFTLGHTSTAADVDAVVAAIRPVVDKARAARAAAA